MGFSSHFPGLAVTNKRDQAKSDALGLDQGVALSDNSEFLQAEHSAPTERRR